MKVKVVKVARNDRRNFDHPIEDKIKNIPEVEPDEMDKIMIQICRLYDIDLSIKRARKAIENSNIKSVVVSGLMDFDSAYNLINNINDSTDIVIVRIGWVDPNNNNKITNFVCKDIEFGKICYKEIYSFDIKAEDWCLAYYPDWKKQIDIPEFTKDSSMNLISSNGFSYIEDKDIMRYNILKEAMNKYNCKWSLIKTRISYSDAYEFIENFHDENVYAIRSSWLNTDTGRSKEGGIYFVDGYGVECIKLSLSDFNKEDWMVVYYIDGNSIDTIIKSFEERSDIKCSLVLQDMSFQNAIDILMRIDSDDVYISRIFWIEEDGMSSNPITRNSYINLFIADIIAHDWALMYHPINEADNKNY